MIDDKQHIRLIAFTEHFQSNKGEPALLLVYILNESKETMEVLNDLDSINIPKELSEDQEAIKDADLIHIDFGVSGEAKFIQVAPGECLKITLLLREEQLALLNRVKYLKTAVKFKESMQTSEELKVFLSARVYVINL